MPVAFSDIDALTFLRDAIDFQYIAGRVRGAVELKGAGLSPLQIVSSLNGRADLLFEIGAIAPPQPAQYGAVAARHDPRRLANESVGGNAVSTFAATFPMENGIARSTNIKPNGPFMAMTAAGSANLRTQTLDFRADPRLVSSPASPGRSAGGWGIGVPVVIQGPWSNPQIYADTPDILADPIALCARCAMPSAAEAAAATATRRLASSSRGFRNGLAKRPETPRATAAPLPRKC